MFTLLTMSDHCPHPWSFNEFRASGTAGAVEVLLYHYVYGKPKETVAIESGPRPLIFEVLVPRPPAAADGVRRSARTRLDVLPDPMDIVPALHDPLYRAQVLDDVLAGRLPVTLLRHLAFGRAVGGQVRVTDLAASGPNDEESDSR